MATELRSPDSMPCHNQQVNSASTPSPEALRPGDPTPDYVGGNSTSKAKPTLLTSHAHSSVLGEGSPQACSSASLSQEHNHGSGNYVASAGDSFLRDSQLSWQIGAQLKLLPMNEQIRELQTIIRDK
ncbi:PREDICTED: uracil phosphoribosyltransferase homolog [Myotis davidii]|uniref:Uracil phosphoribosyltransferase like protein n=1 Tax=Myotis davidii TaxID=225400 RepID=L5MHW9_MYODS|nr:PREDICTED: uracil phosphoribosyltransferase homolog [Myotis davidii]ELK37333.1 Uracil phosphoribosyltransferase like protein [Myotis davidii]